MILIIKGGILVKKYLDSISNLLLEPLFILSTCFYY